MSDCTTGIDRAAAGKQGELTVDIIGEQGGILGRCRHVGCREGLGRRYGAVAMPAGRRLAAISRLNTQVETIYTRRGSVACRLMGLLMGF